MSMLVGVRGQSRESEGAALREGIIQQPGPFYNGNPSSIIWGNSNAAPLWRDETSYSTSSSPFSSVQKQQQRVQEKEAEKDVGMNVAAGETKVAAKGPRRHVARNYASRTANPTAPASSPFTFGFPPQPSSATADSAPAAGFAQSRIPSAGTSFVGFGAGVNFTSEAPAGASNENVTRPGVVLSAPDERMEDIEEVVPAMANLSVKEQRQEAKIFGLSEQPTAASASAQNVTSSWAAGSDVSEKFSGLRLNVSSEISSDRTDSSGVFVFGAKPTSSVGGSLLPKPSVTPAPALTSRPRTVKVKRSVSAAKGKGIATGNGTFSIPSPKGLHGSPPLTGECSFSSPSLGPSGVEEVKGTIDDLAPQNVPSSSSLPKSASQESFKEGVHQSSSERSSPSRSGRNAVFVDNSWVSCPPEESTNRTKFPFVAEKIFNSKEFEQATAKGFDILLPSAFTRVDSTGKGLIDENCSSTQSVSASFAGLTFSDPKSKEMSGKHGLASGHADVKAHSQPVEDLLSGIARKSDGGSVGIAIGIAPRFSVLSSSRIERPGEDDGGTPQVPSAGFPHVNNTVFKPAGGNLHSTCSPPTESVGHAELRKQTGVDTQKPISDASPLVPPEPFVFRGPWSHHSEAASPSTPFKFGAKVNPPSPSLSSGTGGGCVSRNASISVSDLLELKHKNSATDDGGFTAQVEADAVTSSFSTFNLGPTNSTVKADAHSGFQFPFTSTNKSAVQTPVGSGANAASADSVDGDRSSSSYSSVPSQFVFSAGSGSTSSTQATSPAVPGHQDSSAGDAAAALDRNEGTFQAGVSPGPSSVETQPSSQPSNSNSNASFEFRASSDSSKSGSTRRKSSKTHTTAPRRHSRTSTGSKDKKDVGGSFQNFASANGSSVVPDDGGSPMDFSPQRFTPPDGLDNAPDLEQTSKSWSQRSQSLEKESGDGDDEWAQYSETDIAIDNLRTAASNLTLGGKQGSFSGRVAWEGIAKGEDELFWWTGKENSPSKATSRNGKWKRAAFDDNQSPLSGRDNTWADMKMDNANECDSAASSSTPSVDSSASSSGLGPFTFTAGSSPNVPSATSVLRRHARRIQRDKPGAGSVDAGKTTAGTRTWGETVGTTNTGFPKQNNMGTIPGAGLTTNTQSPVFKFETAKGNDLGEPDKIPLGRSVNKTGVSNKGPSVVLSGRANTWAAETSSTLGTMPRTDGAAPTSPRSGAAATEQVCEKWRLRGNQAYANGDFPKAEEYYSRGASSVPPNETSQSCIRASMLCYSNRAATRMVVGRMREALADCMRAMAVDPNFLRVRLRAASCHLALGEIDAAEAAYKECLRRAKDDNQHDTKVSQEATEGLRKTLQVKEYLDRANEIVEDWSSGDISTALRLLNEALLSSPHSERALELKAGVFLLLRKYDEVIQLCEQSLASAERNHGTVTLDSSSHPVLPGSHGQLGAYVLKVWRWQLTAKAKYYLGRLEEALELLQKLEEVSSYYKAASSISSSLNAESASLSISTIRDLLRHKAAGNEAFQAGKHAEAVEHYTAALACSGDSRPFNAVCLCNRAAASQALGHIGDAIADCSRAIALDPKYAKAISRRATLHEKVRDYGQCCHDLQRLITLLESQQQQVRTTQVGPGRVSRSANSTQDLRQARERLAKAEEEMKKGHPLDHYMILGLEPACTSAEIKKAYKKAALRHHPDKAGQFLARSEGGDDGGLWKEVGDEVRREAERLFKLIGEAYAILSDSQKRLRYDQEEDLRKLRTRAGGTTGLSEIYRSTERAGAGVGRRSRDRWDSWSSHHNYGHSASASGPRWQSGPDAAQPDTYARRGSGRYSSNNSSRSTGDGGRWNEYDWEDM